MLCHFLKHWNNFGWMVYWLIRSPWESNLVIQYESTDSLLSYSCFITLVWLRHHKLNVLKRAETSTEAAAVSRRNSVVPFCKTVYYRIMRYLIMLRKVEKWSWTWSTPKFTHFYRTRPCPCISRSTAMNTFVSYLATFWDNWATVFCGNDRHHDRQTAWPPPWWR